MRVTVDLGFSPRLVLVLLFGFVLSAIWFVARRKWRRSVARAEEVKRLLVLAAEESARVETEAAYQYQYYAPISIPKGNQCAVCFSPTTTRCARCKAVHYCSGKCQILHWRQGHKEECRLPSNNHQIDDLVRDHGKKVVEQHNCEVHDEMSQISGTEYETSREKLSLSDTSLSTKISCGKDDGRRVESLAKGNITDSTSELSSSSFSGFSASNNASESSDDSSVCESVISNEHERKEGHTIAETTLDNSKVARNDNSMDVSVSLSPKFASLVDAVDGFSSIHKLNQVITGFNTEGNKLTSNSSSGLSMGKGPTIEPSTISSGFWDKTLESTIGPTRVIKDVANSGPLPYHYDDALSKSSGNNVTGPGLGSLQNVGVRSSGCAGASSIHDLQSVGSKVSNHVVNQPASTLKPVEIRDLPHALADTKLVSRAEGHSHYSTKSGNNDTRSGISTSSQVASSSPLSKNGLKTCVLKVDQFKGTSLSKDFPLAGGSDIAGRYLDKGLFPYDMFVKLYSSNRVELQPFGLINCGNSCYANAILQCLAFTPPLTAYLLQGLHSKTCVNKKNCFTCEFESLIMKSKDSKSPLSPMGILSQLQSNGSQLCNGKEEDAHEFLRHAIETMQSVCLMESGINASDSFKEETNLLGLIFGGYLRSKIKCMKCGRKSERQERMMDLTVEIEGEIVTLEQALHRFTSTETLDAENKYHCVRCKSYEKAKKKLTISEAPNVLTIALKRFQSGKYGKLNKSIQFPEILNFAPFMSRTSDSSPIYKLYGVVVHLDIMNAAFLGHYVCYVKNFQNKWFKVDDSVVRPIELQNVLKEGAYMLFYARCLPRAPRLIRNRIASSESKIKVNGKTFAIKPRHVPDDPGLPALETFYSKFHHLRRVLDDDTSDSSSLFSNNSDEGSCSTDSTRDTVSNEDLADYIFCDSGHGLGSMLRHSNSDGSSSLSSSLLNSRNLPLSDMDPNPNVLLPPPSGPRVEIDGLLYRGRPVDVEKRGVFQLHPDRVEHNRKLDTRSSSGFRETESQNVVVGSNHYNDVNSGISSRKSRERTD